MKGLLVVNKFAKYQNFYTIFGLLKESADSAGITLDTVTHTDLWYKLGLVSYSAKDAVKGYDFIIFWDKDVRLAKLLEESDIPVINSSEAIRLCDDKAETFLKLVGTGIKMPKTFISGKQFFECEDFEPYIQYARELGYPLVLKECFGSFGMGVFLICSDEELINRIKLCEERGFIMQEYIGTDIHSSKDIRIQVVGDRCVASMIRMNDHDFRANINNGATKECYTPTLQEEKMALRVVKELGLDFGGIDILFGENGEPIFCEANSNGQFIGLNECTGLNVADYIIEHCIYRANQR